MNNQISRIKRILKYYFLSLIISSRQFNIEDAIILAGTGRSGTTWAGQAISNNINGIMVNESFSFIKIHQSIFGLFFLPRKIQKTFIYLLKKFSEG